MIPAPLLQHLAQYLSISAYIRTHNPSPMNGNWIKILIFSLIFGILGFILGHICGRHCGGDSCERGGMMHGDACMMHGGMHGMKDDACMHGEKGKCCDMKGDSAEADHDMDGHHMMMHDSTTAK